MDGWNRQQYAAAETTLEESADILDELWREESKAFANWPMALQRSATGEAEKCRLAVIEALIYDMHGMLTELQGMSGQPVIRGLRTAPTDAPNPPTEPQRRPLPLLDQLHALRRANFP